jgi:hypothetical protein
LKSAAVEVIDAMRELQSESDRWRLAEALHTLIPAGSTGFDELVDAAAKQNVGAGLSATTLRLYRDTATRWPAVKRVPNLSFSAHREAMVMPSIDDAAKMLRQLSAQLGAQQVTVSAVRQAITASQGGKRKAAAQPGAAGTTARSKVAVIADLMKGGPELIAAIHGQLPAAELDQLHAGVSKVLAHVERLRAKAAKKQAPAKASPAPQSSRKPVQAAARKRAGDLRGL